MPRHLTAGLVLAASLTFAGCGGTATSPAPTDPSPTGAAPTEAPPATEPASPDGGATACGSSSDPGEEAVTIAGFAFDPDPVTVSVGQAITWTNQDGAPHTATLDDGSCTTENLGRGDSGSLVFNAPGTYPYHCRIHPDAMQGTIEVSG